MDFFHLSVFHISVWGLTAPGNPQTSNPAASPSPQLCGQWVCSNLSKLPQHRKIETAPVLPSGVVEITMPSAGSAQRTFMLPKEMAPGWLFTIKKVAPEVQAKLKQRRALMALSGGVWCRLSQPPNRTIASQDLNPTGREFQPNRRGGIERI